MNKYQIAGIHKFAEIDSYEDGCQLEGGQDSFIDVLFLGNSIDEVIAKAQEFIGVNDDGTERNACEEQGRIDFCRTEKDNGEELTDREVDLWHEGKLRAWYCVYTGIVEEVRVVAA